MKGAGSRAESFNAAKVFESLNIDISHLLPFEQAASTMKLKRIWAMKENNDKLEEKVAILAGLLEGSCELPADTPLLMKVFDDATKTTKILKVSSSNTAQEIGEMITGLLKRPAVLSIQVNGTNKGNLSDDTLRDAHRSILRGETRRLTVSAL